MTRKDIEVYEKNLFTRDEINFLKEKKKAKLFEDDKNYFLDICKKEVKE